MVLRSRLALIIAFLACSFALAAQPVFLEDAPILELPADQDFGEVPPTVLLRVAVLQDSTYTLISVQPANLRTQVDIYLYSHDLFSLLPDGYTPGMYEVEIAVYQSEKVMAKQDEHKLKAEIEDWIVADKGRTSAHQPIRGYLDPWAAEDLAYKTANNIGGLMTGASALRLHDMEVPQSLLEPSQQRLWLQSMQDSEYPYPVLLTSLAAGMGELDNRYALVRLKRNDIFGIKGMYYGLDLDLANAQWLAKSAAQTNTRHSLSLPLGWLKVNLEYADIAQNHSSISLDPVYWRSPLSDVERTGAYLWTQVATNWLDLDFARRRETLRSADFAGNIRNLIYQLRAGKDIQIGNWDLAAHWTQAWRENDFTLPRISYQSEYKSLAELKLGYQHQGFKANAGMQLADLEDAILDADLAYQFGIFSVGMGLKTDLSTYQPRVSVSDIYTAGNMLDYRDIRQRRKASLELGLNLSNLQVGIGLGNELYKISFLDNGQLVETDASPIVIGMGAIYEKDWQVLSTILRHNMLWMQEIDQMRDNPALRGFGELELRRDLAHNNAIFAALGYTFHSSYINLAVPADALEFSLVANARIGVQISKLFDLEVSILNIGDNYIFGVQPVPVSLHAGLRWYFLN